jgi:UDP:flavonoid glycosyltransferase YjiC (YdhE family)
LQVKETGGRRRVLVAAFGDAGHAFPAIALAAELAGRGHQVVVETWETWREAVEEIGLGFRAAEEYVVFPPPLPGEGPGAASAAKALLPLFDELRPEIVVSDILTLAPSLAAEMRGVPRATLIPHLYPVHEVGMPFFGMGMAPPRTELGGRAWRAALPILEAGLRRGQREMNETRAKVGLEPQDRFHGGISDELVIVGTFPQLEYPRQWPREVEVVGPLTFELPHPDIEVPAGEDPIVLVANSTAQDPDCDLIRRSFEGLAGEAVRIVATTNGHAPRVPIDVPANGTLVPWLSYSQLMPLSDVIVCHGGHGTVARALGAGVPLVISPSIGDMAENAQRVAWAGCGLTVPGRLRRGATLRWAVERILGDTSFRAKARVIASSRWASGGAARAADAVEALVAR